MDLLRVLKSAGGGLASQGLLHLKLAQIEWEEEKVRLLRMLVIILLGFAFFLCLLLSAGGLMIAATWATPYRLQACVLLIIVYGAGMTAAWLRFRAWSSNGSQIFAASREELAADAELLRAKA